MTHIELYTYLKDKLCTLFQYKSRGDTLEIITLFTTVNNKFVSVFVKPTGENTFIVTDAGWLDAGLYGEIPDIQDEEIVDHVFSFYLRYYNVQTKDNPSTGIIYYYKETSFDRLATTVFEMAEFIQGMVNAMHLEYKEGKMIEEKKRFSKQVNDFLRSKYDHVEFRYKINDNIAFNASIVVNTRRYLINYITGSTPTYFTKNLTEAAVKFQMVNGQNYLRKLAFINNETEGFVPSKVEPYLEFLREKAGSDILLWSEKDNVETIIK